MIFQAVGKKENPAILFFHAMGVTGESSRPVAEYLKDRYYCMISPRPFPRVSRFQPYAVSDQRSEGLCGNAGCDCNEEHTAGASVFIRITNITRKSSYQRLTDTSLFMLKWVYSFQPSACCRMAVKRRYMPSCAISSSCVPHSAMLPSSTTRIWSAFRMVARRWAMVMMVLPWVSSEIACWMRCSFSGSMLAVASSRMTIGHDVVFGLCQVDFVFANKDLPLIIVN